MIVIDASTISHAFRDPHLRNRILTINKLLRAPTLFISEVSSFKSQVMKESQLSHKEFENKWLAFIRKIVIEDPDEAHVAKAKCIIEELGLDVDDLPYLALCCKYQEAKPTFWTQDSPFVFGEAANCLRKDHNIFGNFNL